MRSPSRVRPLSFYDAVARRLAGEGAARREGLGEELRRQLRRQRRESLGAVMLDADGTGGGEGLGEQDGALLRRQLRRQRREGVGAGMLAADGAGGGEGLGEHGGASLDHGRPYRPRHDPAGGFADLLKGHDSPDPPDPGPDDPDEPDEPDDLPAAHAPSARPRNSRANVMRSPFACPEPRMSGRRCSDHWAWPRVCRPARW